MMYLLWGLLNIGLFIYFIIICFKLLKLIRGKIGLFATIIFAIGILAFIGNSNSNNENNEPNSNQIKTWKFIEKDSLKKNESYLLSVDLEKTLVSKYELGIKYGKDKQGQINIPISAYSSITGFISGINWKPVSIYVYKTKDNNKFEYHVYGNLEWKLIHITIYTQVKEYKGVALIK